MQHQLFARAMGVILLLGGFGHAALAESAAPPQRTSSQRDLPDVLAALTSQQLTQRVGNGCWVRLYEDKDFRGASVTIVGPMDLARLQVGRLQWRDWDSAIIGPQANLTTFDNSRYRQVTARLGPSRHVSDLRNTELGPFEQIRSMSLDCVT